MKIRVGSTIRHSLFSGEQLIGKVLEIQICRRGQKEGRVVKTCDVENHHGVIDTDDGHWGYFYQVLEVLNY